MVLEDLKYLGEVFKQSPELRDFVRSSATQKHEQKEVFDSIAGSLDTVTNSFVHTLIDAGR